MENQTNAVAVLTSDPIKIRGGAFEDVTLFEQAQRVAACLVTSTMVPEQYRGKENLGNAVVAIDISYRLGLPVLMVMQNLYIVYGKPSWSGQMAIGLINSSGMFAGPLEYEFVGSKGKDDWGCRCKAVTKAGKPVEGPLVDIGMAKAEGWYDKNGSKWKTIPEMMLRYRAAAYFGRTKCPEVMIGLHTREEVEDIGPSGPTIEIRTDKPNLDPQPEPKKPREPKPPKAAPVVEAEVVIPPAASTSITSPHDLLWEFLGSAGISWDDFRGFLTTIGKDREYKFEAGSLASVMDLPAKFCEDFIKDTKTMAHAVRIFGKSK